MSMDDIPDFIKKMIVEHAGGDSDSRIEQAKRAKVIINNDYNPAYLTLPKKKEVTLKTGHFYRSVSGNMYYIIGVMPFDDQARGDNMWHIRGYEHMALKLSREGSWELQAYVYNEDGYAFNRARIAGEEDKVYAHDLIEEIPNERITLGFRGNFMEHMVRMLEAGTLNKDD